MNDTFELNKMYTVQWILQARHSTPKVTELKSHWTVMKSLKPYKAAMPCKDSIPYKASMPYKALNPYKVLQHNYINPL